MDEANRIAPAFARVFKEMILVTHPSKPFPRAPKGTVPRKQVLLLYENEIDKLFVRFTSSDLVSDFYDQV